MSYNSTRPNVVEYCKEINYYFVMKDILCKKKSLTLVGQITEAIMKIVIQASNLARMCFEVYLWNLRDWTLKIQDGCIFFKDVHHFAIQIVVEIKMYLFGGFQRS